ncbi:uncharacterized protein L201_007071 [Kwoniella dendrophila CBS 6074]|uniref:HPP transmembrane region domain-containing protein n=1 Tax=Kwoniella dendrophila CBS 6074 TaxID=1295534 RepID=A0AAX4K3D7_9TREE
MTANQAQNGGSVRASSSTNPMSKNNTLPSPSSSPSSSSPTNGSKAKQKQKSEKRGRRSIKSLIEFNEDYRERIPSILSRFIGYRQPGQVPPYNSIGIPPFNWLKYISLKYEIRIFSFLGSLIGIWLIEAVCGNSILYRDIYGSPLIVVSFGASAVLIFGVIESPLSQPRNHIGGNLVGSIIGVCLTKLFEIQYGSQSYQDHAENQGEFHSNTFVNGGLVVALTMLITNILGVVHPPAGATALAAATDPKIIKLSWKYILIVFTSSLLMDGFALIINNLGRRRYPIYWWTPQRFFVKPDLEEGQDLNENNNNNINNNLERNKSNKSNRSHDRPILIRSRESEELALKTLEENNLRKLEDGGRTHEALLIDRLQGKGGSINDIKNASDGIHQNINDRDEETRDPSSPHWKSVHEPLGKVLSRQDRSRAEGSSDI